MGASVRPDRPGLTLANGRNVADLPPAEMWDALVQHGIQPDEATRQVASVHGPPPAKSSGGIGQTFDNVVRSGMQGATFGFGDELVGKAQALALRAVGAHPDEPSLVNAEREKLNQFRQDHPAAAIGSEVAGAVAGGGATGKLLRLGAGLIPGAEAAINGIGRVAEGRKLVRAAQIVGTGAAAGGLAGAGAADNGDRLAGAGRGAVFGGAASAALAPVAAGVGKVLPLVAESKPVRAGIVRLLGGQTAEDAARSDILKQLGRSRLSLNDLEQAAPTALPSEMTLDLGGDAMVSRAGGAVATPSRGSVDIRNALTARTEQAPTRVRGLLTNAMGVGQRENVVQSLEQQAKDRADASGQWYDVLRSHYDQAPKRIAALDQQLGKPSFEDAIRETESILKERNPSGFTPLIETADNGTRRVRPLTFTEADLLKRAMDDVTDVAKVPNPIASGGVTKTRRSAMTTTGSSVTDALDDAFKGNAKAGVPPYAEVRGQHADASKLIDAHAEGTNFLRASQDQLKADFQAMSPAEQEFYRKGALASLEDQLLRRTDGRDVTLWFNNELNREKLRTILPQGEADQLEATIKREAAMHARSNSILANSKTAERVAQQGDAAGPGVGEVLHAVGGNPVPLLNYGLRAGLQRRAAGLTEQQVDALAPLLTAQGPDQIAALARSLREYQARRAAGMTLTNPRAIAQTIGLHTNP